MQKSKTKIMKSFKSIFFIVLLLITSGAVVAQASTETTTTSNQSVVNAKVSFVMKTNRGDKFLFFSTMHGENKVKPLTKISEEVYETTELTVAIPDVFMFKNGKKGNPDVYENTIYLEPGYDLKVIIDEKNIENPYIITGKGAKENQLLINENKVRSSVQSDSYLKSFLDLNTDEGKVRSLLLSKYDDILKSPEFNSSSPDFKTALQNQIEFTVDRLSNSYAAQLKLKQDQNNNVQLALEYSNDSADKYVDQLKVKEDQKNKTQLAFEYINDRNEKIKLSDFKGKYVYIDLWATTCGPCIVQFPYFEKLKEKYKGKNIEFVSISIDKDKNKWTKFLAKHKLSGIQLLCYNTKDEFMTRINIDGIPRMLIIDPQGNLIDFNAKLPSSPELINDIDKLLLK